ncbi:MAG: class I SAM-dependent methyltransferase [Anaerolineae bacterium]|nr:class I SAM-dependent methyltransferase [Anaerolineae bacterium]
MDEKRLYQDLSWLWPLWGDPDGDYAAWCDQVTQLIRRHARRATRTLLDMGCGGGKNAYNLKRSFAVTGIDISPTMLDLAQKLNPECEFLIADMRNCDLGQQFDAVLIDDAISYMVNQTELRNVFAMAYRHLSSGGVMVVSPDETTETFQQNKTRVSHAEAKSKPANLDVVFIENNYDPDPTDDVYDGLILYLIRENGKLRIEPDHHPLGLFPLDVWRTTLREAGFEVHEDPDPDREGGMTLVCIKP